MIKHQCLKKKKSLCAWVFVLDLLVLNNVKKIVHVRLIIENIISIEQKKLPQDAKLFLIH